MKVVFIVPYPYGVAPSQRFRYEQYLSFLEKNNIQYTIKPFLTENAWSILYKNGNFFKKAIGVLSGFMKRWILLFSLGCYDFVFIHREAAPIGPPIFEWVIAKVLRKKIIYDFDDAIWLPNTSRSNRIVAWLKFHSKVKWICKWAYKVSAGNQYLMDYAKKYHSNVIYNPTTIDTLHQHNRDRVSLKPHKKRIIGWTGTHSTIKYLSMVLPSIHKLSKKYEFEFHVISNKEPDFKLDVLKYIPWNKKTEIQDLSQFDIGIMPLSDDPWARGKCGFKALQYMALKIPPVVSAVGVNNQIIQQGINGYLVQREEDWEKYIAELIENPGLLSDIAKNAYQTLLKNYSVQSNYNNFLLLFA